MSVLPVVITMSFRLEVQMVYQHATSEHRWSHLARLQIAADISDRTQSESDQANDDDRCQDCREVTKDAPLPASCFSGSPRQQRRGDYPQWTEGLWKSLLTGGLDVRPRRAQPSLGADTRCPVMRAGTGCSL
jgi:hypothetical protein